MRAATYVCTYDAFTFQSSTARSRSPRTRSRSPRRGKESPSHYASRPDAGQLLITAGTLGAGRLYISSFFSSAGELPTETTVNIRLHGMPSSAWPQHRRSREREGGSRKEDRRSESPRPDSSKKVTHFLEQCHPKNCRVHCIFVSNFCGETKACHLEDGSPTGG